MDRNERKVTLSILGHLITGLCALLFLIAAGLFIVLLLKPLYYFDISYLNLVEESGYPREEIILNYNALVDWCMPWVKDPFSLPTFPSSANAIAHFEEVKVILNIVFVMGLLSLIAFLALISRALKSNNRRRFFFAGIITLAVPSILGAYAATNFSTAFILFHELLFRNELWIFDYKTDPVILILPEVYFLQCTLVILSVILFGAFSLFLLGRAKDL